MVTLTGTFTRLDGTPATGTVRVTPSRSPIMDPDGKIVISGPQVFPLDKDGKLTVQIPASNDPDLGPAFTYSIDVNLAHASWKISKVWIPHGSTTVDLSEIGDYTPTPGAATRTVTIPADGTDGQVLVWDGAGFHWGPSLDGVIEAANRADTAADRAEQSLTMHPADGLETIATRIAFRQSDITVGVAGDSTAAGPTGWVSMWAAHMAARFPHLRVELRRWNVDAETFNSSTVVQAGDGTQTLHIINGSRSGGRLDYQLTRWDEMFGDEILVPGTPERIEQVTARDTFTRTGNLAGSATDTGELWDAATGWTVDDGIATTTGQSQAVLPLHAITRAQFDVQVTTTGVPTQENVRLYARRNATTARGLAVAVFQQPDGTIYGTMFVQTTVGGYRAFPTIPIYHDIPAGQSSAPLRITISMTGTDVTVQAGTQTATATLTEGEAAELATAHTVAILPMQEGAAWFAVDSVEADYTKVTPAVEEVRGDPLDVMIVGHGHNYWVDEGPVLIAEVDGFHALVAERRPSTRVVVTSQNPQFAPSSNPVPHALRQQALREYARRQRIAYLPAWEFFISQPDQGRSLMRDDGVHPTTPTTPTVDPAYGSSEWGRVVADQIADKVGP